MAASLPAPDKPITVAEISKAFHDILCRLDPRRSLFLRLGLAISGGVDSMALAYLWKTFQQNNLRTKPFARGFVVDHGLRPGSSDEARLVASRLESSLGIPAQIISLNWDRHGGVDAVTSIETAARQLRFQALAHAAHAHNIGCMLLGHHADDIVETTLHRIAMNSRGSGLVGLKTLASIPECSGLYGIDSSGGFDRLRAHTWLKNYVGGPETGGLKVARPLLEFSKSRLQATCKDAGLEWIEDNTNQDVTLTQRNVIRSMLKDDVLPLALRKPSILQMTRNIEDNSAQLQGLVRKLYDATYIKYLDLRSGAMKFYLPSESTIRSLLQECQSEVNLLQAFARYLQMLTESISPDSRIKLEKVLPTAEYLFSEFLRASFHTGNSALSFGRLKIVRLPPLHIDGQRHIGLKICRAPFIVSPRSVTDRPDSIALPATMGIDQVGEMSATAVKDNTFLWDGRWWISIQNYTAVPLRLEALDKDKMQQFKNTIPGFSEVDMGRIWKEAGSGTCKWTLPAIVCDELPPLDSMISTDIGRLPINNSHRYKARDPDRPFEIYKYSVGAKQSEEIDLIGRLKTSSVHSLSPSLFTTEDNLSKRPESDRSLAPLPRVYKGDVTAQYPMPNGPFIVAIPTMGFFLNHYWARHLRWDIRYKKINLPDMDYVSRYRMEKQIMIDGTKRKTFVPAVIGERADETARRRMPEQDDQARHTDAKTSIPGGADDPLLRKAFN